MNILQMVPNLELGGVERGTIDLARTLVKDGHGAIIISNGGALLEELKGTNIKHYSLPVHRKSVFSILSLIVPVRKIIRDEQIDLVHARSRVPAWIGYLASKKEKVPFVTTAHGFYRRHPASRVMGFGKRVIVVSAPLKEYMKINFRLTEEKLRLVHRGVNLEKIKSTPGLENSGRLRRQLAGQAENLIGMIGRLTPRKGALVFLEALAYLKRENYSFRALIVGKAAKEDFLKRLKEKVRKENLEGEVIFTGRRDDIPQIISALDLLVFPSVEPESFGRVVVEALFLGKPVIATDLGGVKDIIEDNITGKLVSPGDALSLAQAISWMLEHKEESYNLAQRGRQKVLNEFNLDKMYRETIKVYRECLREK